MSVNTTYYNNSSGWIEMNANTDGFASIYVPQWTADVPTYGRSGATQYNIKIAQDYPTYYKSGIDRTVCWCETDGTEDWKSIDWYSGTTSSYPTSITLSTTGRTSVGMGINGNSSAYSGSNTRTYAQFYKSSSTGTTITGPFLNYDTSQTNLSIHIYSYSTGTDYIGADGTAVSPVTKFDFNTVLAYPVITYLELKSGKTKADYLACTSSSEMSAVVNTAKRCDLASYCNSYNDTILGNDNHIIVQIGIAFKQLRWNVDGTYADQRNSGNGGNTSGILTPLFINTETTNGTLEWTDWYNSTNPKSYSMSVDAQLAKTYRYAPGNITIWDDRNNIRSNGQFSSFGTILIGGTPTQSGGGYNADPSYRYNLYKIAMGERFHCDEIQYQTSEYRKAYRVYWDWTEDFSDIEELREYIRKQVAYLGMYFTDGYHSFTVTKDLNTSNVMLGIIDDSGITHGTYTSGTENENQRQAKWGDDPFGKTPYNPNKPGPGPDSDPNRYNSGMASPTSRSFASAYTIYSGDGAEINTITWFCNRVKNFEDFTNIDDMNLWLQRNFLTSNPIDNIISCKWFPFDTADFMGMGSKGNVKLGNTYVNVSGDYKTPGLQMYTSLTPTQVNTLYLGHFDLLVAYQNFRDYSPYTDATIYFPYCGTASLDLSFCLGHSIYVQYKIDINTGSCTALASLDSYDGDIIASGHGTISIDIPLSGVAQANYQNGIYTGIANLQSAQINAKQSTFNNLSRIIAGTANVLGNAAAGDVGGTLNGSLGLITDSVNGMYNEEKNNLAMDRARYSLKATPVERVVIGNSSAADGSICYQYPTILLTRSSLLDNVGMISMIPDVQGYATVTYDNLTNHSGYVLCNNAKCFRNEGWTEEEIQATIALLNSGITIN